MTQQLRVTPVDDYPLPSNKSEEVAPTLQENVRIAATTATLLHDLGMPFEMTERDHDEAHKLFAQMDKKRGGPQALGNEDVNPPSLYQGNVALKLSALLTEYDHKVVLDATQARTYITNRLLELSKCGDSKAELRALELLGKMSDVGAFTEKSEVTITHRNVGDLKAVLQEKLTKLLAPEVEDVTPRDVRSELGVVEEVSEDGVVYAATEEEEVENELDELAVQREAARKDSKAL